MEENKVAQKLRDVLEEVWRPMRGSRDQYMEDLADAILQSPDLRVTLVPQRFVVEDEQCGTDRGRFFVRDEKASFGDWRGRGYFLSQKWAQEYCDWLNSKEPK